MVYFKHIWDGARFVLYLLVRDTACVDGESNDPSAYGTESSVWYAVIKFLRSEKCPEDAINSRPSKPDSWKNQTCREARVVLLLGFPSVSNIAVPRVSMPHEDHYG